MTAEFEFWPDYGSGPLWIGGASIEPRSVLSEDLAERLLLWNAEYEESKLPLEGTGDQEWLAQGKSLLENVRQQLRSTHVINATELWWD